MVSCLNVVLFLKFFLSLSGEKPNILFILVDDLGWGNVNFNRDTSDSEVVTPNLDYLVSQGLHLTRHYAHFTCTPTRSSFQSGRLPVHVQTTLANPDEPNAGVPRNMTCLGTKFKSANYNTHIVGKWDVGMATFDHTPKGRGYDSSLIYFEHKNDYWTEIQMQSGCLNVYPDIVDIWTSDNSSEGPAYNLNGTKYEEFIFQDRIHSILMDESQSPDTPFFLVYTPHIVHCPLQIPKDKLIYDFDNDENNCSAQTYYVYPGFDNGDDFKCRSIYHSMVTLLDSFIGNITNTLKSLNLWNNTLIVLSSDNGGPYPLTESAPNNYPLKGGKYSPWEGGIRMVAFVSGGYLPENRRGMKENGMIHIADWYTTFCALIGVDPFDYKAQKYGLPPVDGLNVWDLIIGTNSTSPRTNIPYSNQAIINYNYKYLVGNISYSGWSGVTFPNSSSPQHPIEGLYMDCRNGCLFDVESNDISEYNNIANLYPSIVANMSSLLKEAKKTYYSNNEQGEDACPSNVTVECACWMAKYYWNGYFGPYQYFNINDSIS